MALGTFVVTIDGNRLGAGVETSAKVQVKFAAGRQFVADNDTGEFTFPHLSSEKPIAVSLPHAVTLVTDVDAGVSEEIGYEIVVTTQDRRRLVAGPFPAQADGAEIALVDVTSDFEGVTTESIALRAETAADAAEAANAAAQELFLTAVTSDQVDHVEVSDDQPVIVEEGTLWIPSTEWVETHEHPENLAAFTMETRAAYYHHLWGSGVATTDNLGAFGGALFQRLHLAAFYWPEDTAFQSFHAEVTTLGTGVVRFGIYEHDVATGRPLDLLTDLGTIDATSAATKTITTSYSLTRGWHWLAWAWQGTNTTGPVIRARTAEMPLMVAPASAFAPTTRHGTIYASAVTASGALPSTVTGFLPTNSATTVPSVALRRVT